MCRAVSCNIATKLELPKDHIIIIIIIIIIPLQRAFMLAAWAYAIPGARILYDQIRSLSSGTFHCGR